jgi:hypothetical protein
MMGVFTPFSFFSDPALGAPGRFSFCWQIAQKFCQIFGHFAN